MADGSTRLSYVRPGCLFAILLLLFLLPISLSLSFRIRKKQIVISLSSYLATPRPPLLRRISFIIFFAILRPRSDARSCFLYKILPWLRVVSHPNFSLFFFRFHCLAVPLISGTLQLLRVVVKPK